MNEAMPATVMVKAALDFMMDLEAVLGAAELADVTESEEEAPPTGAVIENGTSGGHEGLLPNSPSIR